MSTKLYTAPTVEPVSLAEARAHLNLAAAPNYAFGTSTQTVTLSVVGQYTLSIAGAGSVAIAAGSAVGTGWGSATSATSRTVNITTGGTVTLTVTPTVTAITLSPSLADDTMLTALIAAAREQAEAATRRALCTQTWDMVLDAFPDTIELPYPPLQSVTSIKYLDTTGTEQTLNSSLYRVDTSSEPARITPAYGQDWPDIRGDIGGITIQFVAGYGTAADVPQGIKQWMLLAIGSMWENRETVIVGQRAQMVELSSFADALLAPYRVMTF